jgi:stage V sporulation protein AA
LNEVYFYLKNIKADKDRIHISDFCDIFSCNADIENAIKHMEMDILQGLNKISALDIIKLFKQKFDDINIINIGDTKCFINFEQNKKSNYSKIILLILCVLVLFFGGAITIINFHNDVNMPGVYQNIFHFFGGEGDPPVLMGIFYSVGVFVGFISILNIFSKPNRSPGILDLEVSAHRNQVLNFKQETYERRKK